MFDDPIISISKEPSRSGSESSHNSTGSGRIEGLDGLRSFAVLSVLLYHIWPSIFRGGFLGVDVFFVISGFLITTLLLREYRKSGRIDLGSFWKRRARRLLPALITVVVVSVGAAALFNEDLLVGIRRQVIGALTFSTNWIEIAVGGDYFGDSDRVLFLTFWSLAVEEQFYLLWPVLLAGILALVRKRIVLTAIALAAAAISAFLMWLLLDPNAPTRVYYGTDTHSFGLMIGVALAFIFSADSSMQNSRTWQLIRPLLGFVSLFGFLLAVWFIDSTAPSTYPGGLLIASFISVAAVAALPGQMTVFNRFCKLRPLAWVGERSYGIYLWHWPVLLLVESSRPADAVSVWDAGFSAVAVIALTFALSEASYRWIEAPVREQGFRKSWLLLMSKLRGPMRWPIATFATVSILAACFGVIKAPDKTRAQLSVERGEQAILQREAQQTTVEPRNETPAAGTSNSRSAPPQIQNGPVPSSSPVTAADPNGQNITALGDSVMSGAAPALYARIPGIKINARPILQWRDAPDIVRKMIAEGSMRKIVILNFGTNGGFKEPESEQALREVLALLGPDRRVVLVNTVGVSFWVQSTNERLVQISSEYPNTSVADWYSVVKDRPGLLHRDKTHPNDAGAIEYADLLAKTADTMK